MLFQKHAVVLGVEARRVWSSPASPIHPLPGCQEPLLCGIALTDLAAALPAAGDLYAFICVMIQG